MFTAFIPGLNGHHSIGNQTAEPLPGTNYFAVKEASDAFGIPCVRIVFQTAANPYPTLSEMGLIVARQIEALQDEHGNEGLVAASSIGTGVAFQAFSEMHGGYDFPSLIAFKPVIDPLNAISSALSRLPNNMGAVMMQKLMSGEIEALPIPVEASHVNEQPGHFMLTKAHVEDALALRLISDPTCHALFDQKREGRRMPSLQLLVGEQDTTTSENLVAFATAARLWSKTGCDMKWMAGNHASNQSEILGQAVTAKLLQHLGR